MPAIPTYSPISHVLATARTQLAPTCGYARYAEIHPVPPLKGLRGARAAVVSYRASVPAGHGGRGSMLSYRASAPDGAGTGQRVCVGASGSRPTAYYSLLTRLSPPASKPSNTTNSANLPKIFVLLRFRSRTEHTPLRCSTSTTVGTAYRA